MIYDIIENTCKKETEHVEKQCNDKGICTSVKDYAKACLNTYRLDMYLELDKIKELYNDFMNSTYNTFTEYAQAKGLGVEELNKKLSLGRLLDK